LTASREVVAREEQTNLCKTKRQIQPCSKSINAKLYCVSRNHAWWHQLTGAYNSMQTDGLCAQGVEPMALEYVNETFEHLAKRIKKFAG
jgi:hypothetical protein